MNGPLKRSLRIAAIIACFAASALTQDGYAEREVADFMSKLREAGRTINVAFFEAALAPEYIYSTPSGSAENKAAVLEYFKKLKETQSYRTLSYEMSEQQIRVFGDIAIVTGNFHFVSEFRAAHANDPPHVDEGRYTGVMQKRNGRWYVLTEHDSVKPHDKPTMEKQVAALGRSYTQMIKRNDATAIAKILADDYVVTDDEGKRLTKDEDLATYKDRALTLKIDKAEYLDQKIRMLTGSVAVDHSTIRFQGTIRGTPFDITERITTTWQFRDGRWLIVADHFSLVKPQ